MKVSIEHNGGQIDLSSNLSPKDIEKDFDVISDKLHNRMQEVLYKEVTKEQTNKIKEFVNSKDFNGLDSLNKFFAEFTNESRVKASTSIPILYAEVIYKPTGQVIRRFKFRNTPVNKINEGILWSFNTSVGPREIMFTPDYNPELGYGFDLQSESNSDYMMFIANSTELINKFHNGRL